jgi:ribosomal protein L11 methylase PrmA
LDNVLKFANWFIEEQKQKPEDLRITEISAIDLYREYKAWCEEKKELIKPLRFMEFIIKSKFRRVNRNTRNYYIIPV